MVIVGDGVSRVKNGEEMVVIEDGKVVEVGKDECLRGKGGGYYNVVKNELELGK